MLSVWEAVGTEIYFQVREPKAEGNSRVYIFALHTSEHRNGSFKNATSVQK